MLVIIQTVAIVNWYVLVLHYLNVPLYLIPCRIRHGSWNLPHMGAIFPTIILATFRDQIADTGRTPSNSTCILH